MVDVRCLLYNDINENMCRQIGKEIDGLLDKIKNST